MYHLLFAILLVQATYIDLYQDGQRLLDEGKIKEAETLFVKSVASNPEYIPTLKALGDVYKKLKRFPEAIEQYQKVIEISPNDIHAKGHLAELYSWVGNYDRSIVTYRDTLELEPQHLGLKIGLARTLRWSQRYAEAERLYKEILQAAPDNHEALKGLANTYALMGELSTALITLDRAIALYPNDAELYKEKGTVLAWEERFKEALFVLQKAVELSPNYGEAYKSMGDTYFWMKSYQKATESYKKVADIDPNNIENYIQLARVYKTLGKDRLAEEAVKSALKIAPSNATALDLLREIRGGEGYQFSKRMRETFELIAFLFVLTLVFLAYRGRKRMLRRRHKLYLYFANFVLPALAVLTFVSYLGENILSQWLDTDLLHDVIEIVLFFALGISFFILLWTAHRSKEFTGMVILAIGAHPDDLELGCGGYIMKAKDSGGRVYGLTLTKGERGTEGNGKREQELARAARFMELDDFWVLDFKDTELKNCITEIKGIIEEKIRETRATMVLTHTPIDIHSDHQAVFEATKEAGRNISILCYENVSTPREFVPNYYIDITGYIGDKIKLITFHRTQEEKTYMDPEVIKGRAAHRGLQAGVAYAEAFKAYKLVR